MLGFSYWIYKLSYALYHTPAYYVISDSEKYQMVRDWRSFFWMRSMDNARQNATMLQTTMLWVTRHWCLSFCTMSYKVVGVFGILGVLGVLLAAKLRESASDSAKNRIMQMWFVKTDFVLGVIAKLIARRSLAVGWWYFSLNFSNLRQS